MTLFPEDLLRRIREGAPPAALLRKIGYRIDSIQEAGRQIKCFCPIHKEQVFRTLTVELDSWTYSCANKKCAGAAGGDLIDLYAKCRQIGYEQALIEIAGAFQISIDPKLIADQVAQALEIGDNLFEMGVFDEAERQYEMVVAMAPEDTAILRKLLETQRKLGRAEKVTSTQLRLARALAAKGEREEAVSLLGEYVRYNSADSATRSLYLDCLLKLGRREEVAQEYLAMAEAMAARGDIDQALDCYRRIQAMGVRNMDVSTQIIQMLISAGRRAEAVAELSKRADALILIGQSRLAIDCLTSCLEIDPSRDDLRVRIAEIIAKGRLAGAPLDQFYKSLDAMIKGQAHGPASQALAALIATFPDNPRLLEYNADLEEARGHEEAAMEARLVCVDLFENRREYARAIDAIDRLLRSLPRKPDILARRAQLLTRLGKIEEAAETYLDIIHGFEDAQDWEQAATAYQAVIDLEPDDIRHVEKQFELYVRLGREPLINEKARGLVRAYRAAGMRDKALKAIERVWTLSPETEGLLTLHAEILEETGRRFEAAEQYLGAAKLLVSQNKLDEARAQLEQSLRCMPEHMESRELKADVCMKLNQTQQAVDEYEALANVSLRADEPQNVIRLAQKILMSQPESMTALQLLAGAYERTGDFDKKRAVLMRLVTMYRRQKSFTPATELCEVILSQDEDYAPAIEQLVAIAEATRQAERRQEYLWRLAQAYARADKPEDEKRTIAQILRADPLHAAGARRLIETVAQWGSGQDLTVIVEGMVDRFAQAGRRREAAQILGSLRSGSAARPEIAAGMARLARLEGDLDGVKDALRSQAQALARALRDREAIDVLGELALLLPEDLSIRRWRIELMLRSEMRAEAVEEYRLIAAAHARLGQNEAAESLYREILKLSDTDRPAREALISLYIRNGQTLEARQEIEDLAALELRSSAPDRAIKAYERVFEFDPKNEDIFVRLIAVERQAGDIPGALRYYERLLDIYAEDGQTGAFEQTSHEAIQLAPENWALRWRLAEFLHNAGRIGESVATLMEMTSLQMKANALGEAERSLRRVLEVDKESVQGRALMAELLARRGDKESALSLFMNLAGSLGELRAAGPGGPGARAAFAFGNYEGLTRVKEYTFDQFVVGSRNNFAYASAMAVSRAPGKNYNPLFLYSDVGLGKTHLCHAIANYVLERHPELKVMYTMTEDFTEALIAAIQTNSVAAFRNRHRLTDVLIIDDIQFLSGKERAQEEFFHIFNALFEAGKQIVITSDRPPKNIAHLEKRLRSRFGAGVIVDIQPPDLETRLAIIRRELIQRGRNKEFSDEAAFALAESIPSNIRDLKGALIQVLARHDATSQDINPSLIQQVVDQVLDKV